MANVPLHPLLETFWDSIKRLDAVGVQAGCYPVCSDGSFTTETPGLAGS